MEIEYIEHDGIVRESDSQKGTLTVILSDVENCDDCPAKVLCDKERTSNNVVSAEVDNVKRFKPGDRVTVRMSMRMQQKWITILTVLLSVVIIAVMITAYLTTANRLTACISALAVMFFCFALIWMFRGSFPRELFLTITPSHPRHKQ